MSTESLAIPPGGKTSDPDQDPGTTVPGPDPAPEAPAEPIFSLPSGLIDLEPSPSGAKGRERDLLLTPDPDPIASLRLGGVDEPGAPATPAASFLALDTSEPARPAPSPSPSDDADEGEEPDEGPHEAPAGPPRWAFLALINYASVMTLLCLYLYVNRGGGEGPPLVPEVAEDSSPDPGIRADDAYKTAPIPELPKDRVTALGKPLRRGGLEWTPLAVEARPVTLISKLRLIDPSAKPRDGGKEALWLKVRLANRSKDLAFAPLDEGFVRDREKALPDSFIETSDGARIYGYPLSATSDQSIQGQEFFDLRPGEVKEAWIVSDAQAIGRLGDSNTWRVRLRVGDSETETLGVEFAKKDVVPKK